MGILEGQTAILVLSLPILWLILLVDLYDDRRSSKRDETIKGILIAAVICLGLYLIIYFTSTPNSLPRRGVAVFLICATIFTILWRFFT